MAGCEHYGGTACRSRLRDAAQPQWALTVIEPLTGRIATASGIIDVIDPDVTFAGAGTAYVSQAGNFADAPVSIPANQRFTSINAARDFVLQNEPHGRVMFARGESYATGVSAPNGDSIALGGTSPGALHFVAGTGAGTVPTLTCPDGGIENNRMGIVADA